MGTHLNVHTHQDLPFCAVWKGNGQVLWIWPLGNSTILLFLSKLWVMSFSKQWHCFLENRFIADSFSEYLDVSLQKIFWGPNWNAYSFCSASEGLWPGHWIHWLLRLHNPVFSAELGQIQLIFVTSRSPMETSSLLLVAPSLALCWSDCWDLPPQWGNWKAIWSTNLPSGCSQCWRFCLVVLFNFTSVHITAPCLCCLFSLNAEKE